MAYEHVTRTATCKRCGSKTVTWQKSERGKWYLTEVFEYPHGGTDETDAMTDHRDFHSLYCASPEAHKAKQTEIIATYLADKEEEQRKSDNREAERIEAEAEKLAAFLRMSLADRAMYLISLENKIKREARDMTMDYMGEFIKSQQIIAELRAEIDMYADFMEDVEED